MKTVGFVLNPIAGMGGRVGLKGTDGQVERARELGAEPRAPERAREALAALYERAPSTRLVTAGSPMGAEAASDAGFEPEVVAEPADPDETTAADTRNAVAAFVERGVDVVLFVGGDGTAVDVARVLANATSADEVPDSTADSGTEPAQIPMLGVPAGVKVYSAVFGVTPADAGRVVAEYDRVEAREVSDIDEEAYRAGAVRSEVRAVVLVPVADGVQAGKQLAGGTVETLAEGFAADADPGTTYVLGPGGTLGTIKRELGFEGSPLGVDVWRDGEVLARDANEAEILEVLEADEGPCEVVVSPIGGQGFVLGRGNQQLSPAVVRLCELTVVASREKLDDVGVLRVDTGDRDLDESLRGWRKVRVGRFETRMLKVV